MRTVKSSKKSHYNEPIFSTNFPYRTSKTEILPGTECLEPDLKMIVESVDAIDKNLSLTHLVEKVN